MYQSNPQLTGGVSAGLMAALIWGAWPVMSGLMLSESIRSFDIAFLRFAVGGSILLPFLILRKRAEKTPIFTMKGFVLSMGAGIPYVMLALIGIDLAGSVHFGLIAPSSQIVFATIGSHFLLKEKLSRRKTMGSLIILIGLVWLNLKSLELTSLDTLIGDLMFMGCGLLWATYTVLSKYWKVDPWVGTAQVNVVSMCLFAPIYFMFFSDGLMEVGGVTIITYGFFQGVLTSIGGLYFFSLAIRNIGASKAALFTALVPCIALALVLLLQGTAPTMVEFMGCLLVMTGMVIALTAPALRPTSVLYSYKKTQ